MDEVVATPKEARGVKEEKPAAPGEGGCIIMKR